MNHVHVLIYRLHLSSYKEIVEIKGTKISAFTLYLCTFIIMCLVYARDFNIRTPSQWECVVDSNTVNEDINNQN